MDCLDIDASLTLKTWVLSPSTIWLFLLWCMQTFSPPDDESDLYSLWNTWKVQNKDKGQERIQISLPRGQSLIFWHIHFLFHIFCYLFWNQDDGDLTAEDWSPLEVSSPTHPMVWPGHQLGWARYLHMVSAWGLSTWASLSFLKWAGGWDLREAIPRRQRASYFWSRLRNQSNM